MLSHPRQIKLRKNINTHFHQQLLLNQYFQYILQWSCAQLIYQLIFLVHLQFSYSPTSHDLLHSHSQLLGFQIDLLLHTPLSINSLHSHLHLSSFQRYLLLKMLASNLHLYLHVSCCFIVPCFISS